MFHVFEKLLNLSNRINRFNLAMFVVVWILTNRFLCIYLSPIKLVTCIIIIALLYISRLLEIQMHKNTAFRMEMSKQS